MQYSLVKLNKYICCTQGEIEIKDSDVTSSNVQIEIEKLGSSEIETESISIRQTLVDVGHGDIFLLQLVGG